MDAKLYKIYNPKRFGCLEPYPVNGGGGGGELAERRTAVARLKLHLVLDSREYQAGVSVLISGKYKIKIKTTNKSKERENTILEFTNLHSTAGDRVIV